MHIPIASLDIALIKLHNLSDLNLKLNKENKMDYTMRWIFIFACCMVMIVAETRAAAAASPAGPKTTIKLAGDTSTVKTVLAERRKRIMIII